MNRKTRNPIAWIALLIIGLSLVSALTLTASLTVRADPGVLYAAPTAQGSGDCSGWENACTLQTALAGAVSGDETWVKAGVHYPGSNRADTFALQSGVALYGGFAGSETGRDQRDWQANLTVLSGDIDQNDLTDPNGVVTDTAHITGTNVYHVVTSVGVTETAVLDGFVITAGQANGGRPDDYGGGMLNLNDSSPTLTNVTFSGNMAAYGGGMLNLDHSNPTLTNVTFSSNRASYGGGMNNINGSPTLTNVSFGSNLAFEGGGMYNTNSSPTLIVVAFSDNSAGYCGGMLNYLSSNPTLTNVTFSSNSASYDGGGMCNYSSSSPTLTNVTFGSNSASNNGGGMCSSYSSPTLIDVTFSGNSAFNGGGVLNGSDSNPTLTNVSFSDNIASNRGGGMMNYANPLLTRVAFTGNYSSHYGGGMMNYGSPTLIDVTFSDNTAANSGGGMATNNGNPTLTNVTFNGNSAAANGGGMHNYSSSSPNLTNVTFSANSADYGGGMNNWTSSSPTLTNVILWGNTADNGANIFNDDTSTPQISYGDIQGCGGSGSWNSACGADGGGNVEADPLFVDAANGDYHLGDGSPCIDAGTNDAPNLPPYDWDGDPRIVDGDLDGTAVVDMGVDEFIRPLHLNRAKMNAAPAARPGLYKIIWSGRFHDEFHTPVAGATVYGEYTYPDGSVHPKSGLTDGLGRVKFPVKESLTGSYTFCVTDVVKDGYFYDPAAEEWPACMTKAVP